MDFDHDLEMRRSSGRSMVTLGIVLMVLALVGTVARSMSSTHHGYGNDSMAGFEYAQSAWFVLPFFGGLALIVIGSVRKSNAAREAQERLERATRTTELVPNEDVPGGPFRGALKEVEVPDPILAAADEAAYLQRRSTGGVYLIIGLSILAATVIYMTSTMMSVGGSAHARVDHILTAFGLGVFPFGLGLFFTIKGGLMRSK